jgi:hypothetical protein
MAGTGGINGIAVAAPPARETRCVFGADAARDAIIHCPVAVVIDAIAGLILHSRID